MSDDDSLSDPGRSREPEPSLGLTEPALGLAPQRVHPAWIFISAVRQLRGIALPLGVAVILQRGDRQLIFLAVSSAVAAIGLIGQFISWLYVRYEVTGGELRVRSGLLNRRERSVPLERIQAVDTSEDLLQRVFRVVQVTVETAAGGEGTDVKLEALSRSDATRLISRLDAARLSRSESAFRPATDTGTDLPTPTEKAFGSITDSVLIRRISTGELLLGAATSGRVGPALAIIATGWQFADDILGEDIWNRLALQATHTTVQGIAFVATIIAVVAWLMAFVSSILTFGGFEVRRQDDRLVIRHGLLDRRQSTVPISRIQAIEVTEPILRQPFRRASLRFESAGYGKDTADSGVLFPILPRSAVPAMLAQCAPGIAIDLETLTGVNLTPLPERARRRYVMSEVTSLLIAVAVLVLAAALLPRLTWWWGLLPVLALPLIALYGNAQFTGAGWRIDEQDRLILRRRTLTRRTTIVPRQRLQRRLIRQNLFQRRAELATFTATIASGGQGGVVSLRHLDAGTAADLADRLGPRRRSSPQTAAPDRL